MGGGYSGLLANQPVIFFVQALLLVIVLLLLLPIAIFCGECLAALLPVQRQPGNINLSHSRTAILVPAHNEALGIATTLKNLLPELTAADQLVVIADNCNDETADIARQLGATVLERQDSERRGKGYALDFGLRYLSTNPPDVVVIVDADCLVSPGTIGRISELAKRYVRPVQATYLLTRAAQPSPKQAVSVLAFTVKNLVRPLGLAWFGLPCLLTGTGMALPWVILDQVSLASSNIVEDMKLALDLAIAGYPPLLCADVRVTGSLPQQNQAAKSQRTRWEHGHLQTLITQVPRLLRAALEQKRFDLLAMALDLSVPPLSLLVMLWLAAMVVTTIAALFLQITLPATILAVAGGLLLAAVLAAWAKFARQDLPIQTLAAVPLYVLWKIPLYFKFLVKPQSKWVRTERDAK